MISKKYLHKPGELFKYLPELETERLILRKLNARDSADVFEYASVHEVSKYVTWTPHNTIADSKSFLKHELSHYRMGLPASWGITIKDNGKLIGTGGYIWWLNEHAKAEVGYVISDKYWNKGFMTEALKKILEFGFDTMKLERIEARCFTENTASERVMQKCGMKLEGILRRSQYIKGAFRDFKLYSILKSEFK